MKNYFLYVSRRFAAPWRLIVMQKHNMYDVARSFWFKCCYRGFHRFDHISCSINTISFLNVATWFGRDNNISVHLVNESVSTRSTLLDTNLVNVWDAEGNLHTVRAMIDPCSQCSFVSNALCKKLQFATRLDILAVSKIVGKRTKFV